MSAIYNLHKRHGQFSGFQNSIFDLKMLRFSEFLMLIGESFHIFGPRKENTQKIFIWRILNCYITDAICINCHYCYLIYYLKLQCLNLIKLFRHLCHLSSHKKRFDLELKMASLFFLKVICYFFRLIPFSNGLFVRATNLWVLCHHHLILHLVSVHSSTLHFVLSWKTARKQTI